MENKGFCYFALFHSGSKKSIFWTRLGPPNPPKSPPKRLLGRPRCPKMASKPASGPPRWPSSRAPRPPNRLPDRPRSNLGGPGTLQAPILAARDPFCLRFGGPKRHFVRPGTNFPAPKHPFSTPNFPLPQSSMPPSLSKPFQTFPSLSKPPNLQSSMPPSHQTSKLGPAECAQRFNNFGV